MLHRYSIVLSLVLLVLTLHLNAVHGQQEFLTYEDSQGRFTIQYPPNWEPFPAENRFAEVQVEFLNTNVSLDGGLVGLDVRIIPEMDEELVND